MENKWLEWARKMQTIAQAGLTYSDNIYDVDRYNSLKDLCYEIMSEYTKIDKQKITDLLIEEGYPTPKVDIRAVIFKEGKILLVQEKSDKCWSLPGGWADIGLSPSEVATKEVREEAGFEIKPVKLLGVFDRKCHPHPPSLFYAYKIILLCEIVGGEAKLGVETCGVDFFSINNLPPLSKTRNTKSQIEIIFEYLKNPNKEPFFD